MAPCLLAIMLVFTLLPVATADAETRKLKLYFLHTGERAEITYKRNGKYIKGGLQKINRFLRDWRRNEPTKMNPRLLDLIHDVYKETGSRKHIHVISGYRAPATNNLLRKRGRGVAKKSQHTLGNALDFFIPGVSLTKLRNIGLKQGLGGVGFYPKSGSPFVHMDVGRVRHWPRMNRKQLVRVFPRGKTLHVPTDGKPLPGYNIAKANYERTLKGQSRVKIATAEEIRKKPSILAKLFSREDDETDTPSAVSAPKAVKAKTVKPVTPEPAPVETPETILAALSPKQTPVPLAAPRIAIVKPDEIEIAETQVASLDAEEQTTDDPIAEEAPLQEVAFAIPVPAQRPSYTLEADTIIPEVEEEPKIVVAALSSNEIADLRQQVYATLEREVPEEPVLASTTEPANIPFKPATTVNESIPFQSPTQLEPKDLPSLIVSAPNAIENQIASVEPLTTGSSISNDGPTPRPQLVTALLPIEQSAKATGKISVPTPSPTTPVVEVKDTEIAEVSNIPVPQQAIRPIVVAANTQSAPTRKPARVIKQDQALSSEEFKSANLDERLTGKWALATDASIKDIADIRPPAYGRSVLRALPSSVLSSGFSQGQIGSSSNGFSGSSLEFLDFKNLK